ncbi:serine protease ami-like isoform X2 [Penaeus chinensis]|uniref:serine protease ami-like isoform X2 n=1 Tax=Penaeus chinensis TaxID=139456 RepID=UPI001FB5EF6C|nr:serine protease ami-like isoform X2 [Penaeus chinensis]
MFVRSLCIAVALQLLLPSGEAQGTGEQCERLDGTIGTCMELGRCLQSDGNTQSVINLRSCATTWGDIRQTPVCCRSNPRKVARAMCSKWNSIANNFGICEATETRIHNGIFAQLNEFPHMVALVDRFRNQHAFCGGTLISENFVLTAAHCIEGKKTPSEVSVRVGVINLQDEDSQTFQVLKIWQHPLYRLPSSYHDIALLQLATKLQLSKSLLPACLPTQNGRLQEGKMLTVAGWGKTEVGKLSNVLQKGFGRTVSRFACDDALDKLSNNRVSYSAGITDSIICLDESNSGSCKGDSGGPLTEENVSTCQHIVLGIVSKGSPHCQRTTIPGIYTNVEHYIQWIVDIVWRNENA